MNYIVVRLGKEVRVIFEKNFIEGNQYRTQNLIIQVFKLLGIDDFSVDLCRQEVGEKEGKK